MRGGHPAAARQAPVRLFQVEDLTPRRRQRRGATLGQAAATARQRRPIRQLVGAFVRRHPQKSTPIYLGNFGYVSVLKLIFFG